jgi:hypothetical protein
MEKVAKESDGREDNKKSFVKMYERHKDEEPHWE